MPKKGENPANSGLTLYFSASSQNRACSSFTLSGLSADTRCDGCSRWLTHRRPRVGVAVLLCAATVVCGVGLMATAGYLISRAAERPAILSLTMAIVAVRFFGL